MDCQHIAKQTNIRGKTVMVLQQAFFEQSLQRIEKLNRNKNFEVIDQHFAINIELVISYFLILYKPFF